MEKVKLHTVGRVRETSTNEGNLEIDQQTIDNIHAYGYNGPLEIEQRLKELEKEWDVERVLEINASTLALSGIVLAATKDKRWLLLSGLVTSFLLQHGIQGWCPPLPVLRKFGFRTRREIDEERYALKALRGDFNKVLGITKPEGLLNIVRS